MNPFALSLGSRQDGTIHFAVQRRVEDEERNIVHLAGRARLTPYATLPLRFSRHP
jgi:hypothetical protein